VSMEKSSSPKPEGFRLPAKEERISDAEQQPRKRRREFGRAMGLASAANLERNAIRFSPRLEGQVRLAQVAEIPDVNTSGGAPW
jgi:hypothetical protein